MHIEPKISHIPFRDVHPMANRSDTTYNLLKNEERQLRDDVELHVFP